MTDESSIERHYRESSEGERLHQDVNRLERVRTERLLERYLPESPAVVRDVGGGPGYYACELATEGYEVYLLDLVERHVRQARERAETLDGASLAGAEVGDARELPWDHCSSDAVLLLGPLYHLQEAAERRDALREAYRVLEPGGLLMAAGISRFASTLEGLVHGRLEESTYAETAAKNRRTGRNHNPTGDEDHFTDAYFHRPEELRREVSEAGFRVESLLGIEGLGWLVRDFNDRWEEPHWRKQFLRIARELEEEPSVIGASAHLMAVGTRPP